MNRFEFNNILKRNNLFNIILEEDSEYDAFYGGDRPSEDDGYCGALIEHSGYSGGSCWDDDNPEYFCKTHKRIDFLSKILRLVAPGISFLDYQMLREMVEEGHYEDHGYYGNSDEYQYEYINLKSLFLKLVEIGQLDDDDKVGILVAGLPLSGKTTWAQRNWDLFLIDDPKDQTDIIPHLHRKRIVITDPHLSFQNNRKAAYKMLTDAGFKVYTKLIGDNYKGYLIERAKKEGKEDRISFIQNFNVEELAEWEVSV